MLASALSVRKQSRRNRKKKKGGEEKTKVKGKRDSSTSSSDSWTSTEAWCGSHNGRSEREGPRHLVADIMPGPAIVPSVSQGTFRLHYNPHCVCLDEDYCISVYALCDYHQAAAARAECMTTLAPATRADYTTTNIVCV